jgi:cytochrome c oxidase cbb3-type subunit III
VSCLRPCVCASLLSMALLPLGLAQDAKESVSVHLHAVGDSISRGEIVYKNNCILCHGIQGDGKGRAAPLFHPPPADLTHSDKDDKYKSTIIRLGGAAMGRSSGMPPWEGRLTEIEIHDLVIYLRTIVMSRTKP